MTGLPPASSPRATPRPSPYRRRLLGATFGTVAVAGLAIAAVTLVYNQSSTQTLSLQVPPIVWVAGPDTSGNVFVTGWTLSSNATYYSLTLKPVPEANLTFSNFTTMRNQDSAAHTVTVTATSLSSNTKVLDAKVYFKSYGTDAVVGTLNLKDASPSVSLGSLSAGAYLYTTMHIKLDTGAGVPDLPSSISWSLSVT